MNQTRYPWRKWLSRKGPVKLLRGRDYDCQPHSMSQQARNAASRAGVRISVRIDEDEVTIRRTS